MKTQSFFSTLGTMSLLTLAVACGDGPTSAVTSDRYAEGFAAGKAEGYDLGYDDGDADGYARAEAYFKTADYARGFSDGNAQGLSIGYTQGYGVGRTDGYNIGVTAGQSIGYAAGQAFGYNLGYSDGYDDGTADGYDLGYDDGYSDGYDVGYDDGFSDGYGLSVGPTPKLKGYADILSLSHNQMFDYSKIKAPVATKNGLSLNGKLIFSSSSMTNKDTLKKAAVVEQYLVIEMSKQVQAKFGLSFERALKVAKASNHFRKFATSRALTSEDTNAYAKEIIGSDFKSIAKAYETSMKGDLSNLNSIIENAAKKNEISPEKMSEMVTKLFL